LKDENGEIIGLDQNPLIGLDSIDISGISPKIHDVTFTILCDVENPLLGVEGAAAVFGPQKGADEKGVAQLERLLSHFNEVIIRTTGKDLSKMAGAGAAGGIAVTLSAFFNTQIVSGIDYLLDKMGFDAALEGAGMVVSAEGRVDAQTLSGKGPLGVVRRAKEKGIPSVMLAGNANDIYKLNSAFDAVFPITNGPVELSKALELTAIDLEHTSCQIGNLLEAMDKRRQYISPGF
jgi:glycerate kinase